MLNLSVNEGEPYLAGIRTHVKRATFLSKDPSNKKKTSVWIFSSISADGSINSLDLVFQPHLNFSAAGRETDRATFILLKGGATTFELMTFFSGPRCSRSHVSMKDMTPLRSVKLKY